MGYFLSEDFLLNTEPSKRLFHEFAESMPIFDYHCHLSPQDIADNRQYKNLTEIWLAGDHYKWRAMRAAGVSERLITGDALPRDKFIAWAETVPKTIGNPLYHWTHLELKKPFGIDDCVLNGQTAGKIWDKTTEQLTSPEFSTWGILKKMQVKVVCTTDDPADSLEPHQKLAEEEKSFRMLPAFRPDKAMAFHSPEKFNDYLLLLEKAADKEIISWNSFMEIMDQRHDYFHQNGCRLSDHALDVPVFREAVSLRELDDLFSKVRGGITLSNEDCQKMVTAFMLAMGRLNHKRGWVMQIHLGALRSVNSRMLKILGPDTGYDSIQDGRIALPLARFLNSLESTNQLPKMILYPLNPADNDIIATLIGNFQGGGIPGKIQFGSGWWFNDQKMGMTAQMSSLANMGLLSCFVGMVTDSRSLLSYPRHEYFRRVLCRLVGGWVAEGEAPEDYSLLGEMIKDISYRNSLNYFDFPL